MVYLFKIILSREGPGLKKHQGQISGYFLKRYFSGTFLV